MSTRFCSIIIVTSSAVRLVENHIFQNMNGLLRNGKTLSEMANDITAVQTPGFLSDFQRIFRKGVLNFFIVIYLLINFVQSFYTQHTLPSPAR